MKIAMLGKNNSTSSSRKEKHEKLEIGNIGYACLSEWESERAHAWAPVGEYKWINSDYDV